ncbi:MAG TPA: hypothetical protein VGQ91_00305 [Ideonella sp.]|jgi:hypothetical protein|nr:hypothetical protein [Ideonella sp.]
MKRLLIALAFVLPLALPHTLWAQQLVGFKAEKERVSIDEPVKLVLSFKQQRDLVWCGLRVDFGDGEARDVRVEQNPLTLTKQYHRAGHFMPRAEGKTMLRGLMTALACDGHPQTASVQVEAVVEAPTAPHEPPNAPKPVDTSGSGPSAVPPKGHPDAGQKPIVKPPVPPASAPKDNYLKVF